MRLARRLHNWIALAVGLQALLWIASGAYMVAVPIDVIHGDHLVHVQKPALNAATPRLELAAFAQRYPDLTGWRLRGMLGTEVYELRQGKTVTLVDAASGVQLSPLGRDTVARLAAATYAGSAQVRAIDWLAETPPELRGRPAPLWAVRYDDIGDTTLYFSPQTGELVARRHGLWRWFDFLWMLHIMDYQEREDTNNTLLRLASAAGLALSLSGAWLLVYSFRRRKRA